MTCITPAPPLEAPTRPFAVSSIHQGRHSLLLLRGELDVFTVTDLAVLLRLCTDLRQERIVVDLRDLTFVGAAGLAVLVEADRRLRGQGGELVVRNPSPFTSKLLGIAGLAGRCGAGDHPPASPSLADPPDSAA